MLTNGESILQFLLLQPLKGRNHPGIMRSSTMNKEALGVLKATSKEQSSFKDKSSVVNQQIWKTTFLQGSLKQ